MCCQNLEINLLNNASFTSYLKECRELNFDNSLFVYVDLMQGAFLGVAFGFGVADCQSLI